MLWDLKPPKGESKSHGPTQCGGCRSRIECFWSFKRASKIGHMKLLIAAKAAHPDSSGGAGEIVARGHSRSDEGSRAIDSKGQAPLRAAAPLAAMASGDG